MRESEAVTHSRVLCFITRKLPVTTGALCKSGKTPIILCHSSQIFTEIQCRTNQHQSIKPKLYKESIELIDARGRRRGRRQRRRRRRGPSGRRQGCRLKFLFLSLSLSEIFSFHFFFIILQFLLFNIKKFR